MKRSARLRSSWADDFGGIWPEKQTTFMNGVAVNNAAGYRLFTVRVNSRQTNQHTCYLHRPTSEMKVGVMGCWRQIGRPACSGGSGGDECLQPPVQPWTVCQGRTQGGGAMGALAPPPPKLTPAGLN